MKALFTVLACLLIVGTATAEVDFTSFVGGMAAQETGYWFGGMIWDQPLEFVNGRPDWLPPGIITTDDAHWKKCGMGVVTFVLAGLVTKQENEDMAYGLAGVAFDIGLKTVWRAWVHQKKGR